MRLPALALLLGLSPTLLGGASGQSAPRPAASVGPGQVWRLDGVTADGERFQTVLRLGTRAPAGRPLTYRADRGVLLYDPAVPSLVALDTAEARDGGLALACVTRGATGGRGVLVSGPLAEVSARLPDAFAVVNLARTPADLAAATKEVRLGTCTLSRRSP